jgi:hypothetical protein
MLPAGPLPCALALLTPSRLLTHTPSMTSSLGSEQGDQAMTDKERKSVRNRIVPCGAVVDQKADRDPKVRIAAVQRLSPRESKSELEHLARHDPNSQVRIAAIQQLEGDVATQSVVYCMSCGAVPGAITDCPCTQSRVHSVREGKGPVYCTSCGATPGQPSPCPRSQGRSHSFKSR